MRYLYIIGNGLDLSLGLKTDYQSFYDYYSFAKSSDASITELKAAIAATRYESWSDLEYGLGQYSSLIDSPEAFLKCLNDLRTNLIAYLKTQFSSRNYQKDIDKFINDLIHPELYLEDQTRDLYLKFIRESGIQGRDNYAIVTLNYTETIEDILSSNSSFASVLHLHGSLTDSPVLGINDASQLKNELFRNDSDIIEDFIKPEFNDACLNNRNIYCEQLIKYANVFVLFGTSLGETDKKWWLKIGERMQERSTIVLYFPYDENKDIIKQPNRCRRWTKEYREELLSKLGVPKEKYTDVMGRVCVGINKPFLMQKQRPKKVIDVIQNDSSVNK